MGTATHLIHGFWQKQSGLHLWIEQVDGHKIVTGSGIIPGTFPPVIEDLIVGKRYRHRVDMHLMTPKGRGAQVTRTYHRLHPPTGGAGARRHCRHWSTTPRARMDPRRFAAGHPGAMRHPRPRPPLARPHVPGAHRLRPGWPRHHQARLFRATMVSHLATRRRARRTRLAGEHDQSGPRRHHHQRRSHHSRRYR